jgi:nitrate reductase gamma subunit
LRSVDLNLGFSLLAVAALILIPLLGVAAAGLNGLFGVWIPCAAFLFFIGGMVYRVALWAKSPVPFHIPTTCGQQKSLPWIQNSRLESPSGTAGVAGRMALEILLFRSLFRNTKVEMKDGRPLHGGAKWLWLAGLAFHWSFLVIVLRHLRFFSEPILPLVNFLAAVDGIFEIGIPSLFVSDALFLVSVTYLFLRRVAIPQVRAISLPSDTFPLLLILAIGLSGFFMRHVWKVDLSRVKLLALGWVSFHPRSPEGLGVIFYLHLFLVSILLAYIPLSKLAHMGGAFLSPTRNLANDSRMRRHVNPWDQPVKVHTYEEYEDEFRDKMKAAGIPVEKE